MRLVITDTGMIWNKDNQFLKAFKDIILVVCLEGKQVTEDYECFVSPYEHDFHEMDSFGLESHMFKALASVGGKLNDCFDYHDDIVFLTDSNPTTLYPFYVTKDLIDHNSIHLITMPPLDSEDEDISLAYNELLSDLTKVDSVLYYDKEINAKNYETVSDELGNMLPCILNGIYHMEKGPCFFDFSSMKYIPLRDGYNGISLSKKKIIAKNIDFPIEREFWTLGLIMSPHYPEEGERIKKHVERPVPRLDGKKICNQLRKHRIELAKANNITFESAECPSIGPCAGTCEKCDAEAAYLRDEMQKIPKDKRIYPQFDPVEEVTV